MWLGAGVGAFGLVCHFEGFCLFSSFVVFVGIEGLCREVCREVLGWSSGGGGRVSFAAIRCAELGTIERGSWKKRLKIEIGRGIVCG